MSGGGRRKLTDDERALWNRVTRSVAALKRKARFAAAEIAGTQPPHKLKATAKPSFPSASAAVRKSPPAPKPAPTLAPLERRQKQRLARGRQAIDARLDLHGRTLSEAHGALLHFLRRTQAEGAKFVLVITGKGARADQSGERGVLRRQVPQWLRLPEFRPYVVGFEDAHIGHGGEGALYVRVRRKRGD